MPRNNKPPFPARVILAEDDLATARLIKIALEQTGVPHDLEMVRDGKQAIVAVEKNHATGRKIPDLLLLDLHMPGKDGFEVLEYVKQHARLRRMPVVIFSNSDKASDVAKAYDLHVNAYVRKGSDFDDLCDRTETILRFWLQTATTQS
jgi:two-component system, chemotaxis family, response regulator Rcp1